MKTSKEKNPGLQETKCSCKINLKAGEIGLKLSVKGKGKDIKHYTAKGKEKYSEYFLASLVKTFADLFKIENVDLVKYQYEESPLSISKKEDKDLEERSVQEQQAKAMREIQEVLTQEAAKGVQTEEDTIKKITDAK